MVFKKRTFVLVFAVLGTIINIIYQFRLHRTPPLIQSDAKIGNSKTSFDFIPSTKPAGAVIASKQEEKKPLSTLDTLLTMISPDGLLAMISTIFDTVLQSITEPPLEKRVWAKPSANRLSLAIVEPRAHDNLRGVLSNMAHVYGGMNVSLFIFHGTTNLDFVKKQIPDWTDVQYVDLNVTGLSYPDGYNALMKTEAIYKNFQSEFVLVFQTDTVIRHAIPELFYEYDYVGAPWPHNPMPHVQSPVGNGGFSLRRVSAMLEDCRGDDSGGLAEDLFFSSRTKKGGLPTAEIAKGFAAEMATADNPAAVHQIYRFLPKPEIVRLLYDAPGVPKHTTT